MDWRDYIEQNPKVMVGKPVIKGTRITVELILERLGAGWSQADIYASFPHLPQGSIQAACQYASSTLSSRREVYLEEAMG